MTICGLATTIKVVYRRGSIITTNKTVVGRCMSKVAARWNDECYGDDQHYDDGQSLFKKNMVRDRKYEERIEEKCWIPDSRTGIYYPRGHELVLKDVPDGAASFSYTYWHRNCDINGV